MQQGNFINVFLARHVSGIYAHHRVRMLPHGTIRTAHMTYAAALKTTTHPKTRCRKPNAVTRTSNAPDDGRMYPKHVELRIHQQNDPVASSWHFKLFQ